MNSMICIFHFNRGKFLLNCIQSAREFLPNAPIIIFDDHSSDPESIKILHQLSQGIEVIRPKLEIGNDNKTGGLYHNMNAALKMASERGFKYTVMIQEDMQFIRPISESDWADIEAGFQTPNASFVMYSCFSKTKHGKRPESLNLANFSTNIVVKASSDYENDGRYLAYSDFGIFNVSLFFEQQKSLQPGERANDNALRKQNLQMSMMCKPIMHFLPFPISYHGGDRSLKIRIIDWLSGAGVHPIKLEKSPEVSSEPPYAEDVLTATALRPVRYWSYHGGARIYVSKKA